jgi:hypothetical protein
MCAGSTLLLAEDALTRFIVKRRPCWSVTRLTSITFSRLSALLLIDKPWFLTEGKDLLLCSSFFPLGVSQLPGHNHHQLHARHQTSTHKASKTAEASAMDVVLNVTSTGGSEKIVLGGSSAGKGAMAEDIGDASKWKKRVDALFHLDTLQEQASNPISSAMTAFVQRTGIVKEVRIPCSP